MTKNIVLPEREELKAIFTEVSDDFGLMSDLYPALLEELAGKELSKSEIEKIVVSESKTYLDNHLLSESVGSWMELTALDIINELVSK